MGTTIGLGRRTFGLLIVLVCPYLIMEVMATGLGFDLNEPPEESYVDLVSSSTDSATPPLSGMTSEVFPGGSKRKADQEVQRSSPSPSSRRARLLLSPDEGLPSSDFINNPRLVASQGDSQGSPEGDQSERHLPDLPELEQKLWDDMDYSHLLAHGQIIEEVLHGFSERFQARNSANDGSFARWTSSDKHPSLPVARISRLGQPDHKLAKILHHKRAHKQRSWRLYTLYNRLAVSLFQLHARFLTLLNIPILNHRDQQEKFFRWLEKEIYEPANHGHPILGPAPRPELSWKANLPMMKIGSVQEELIKYFSEQRADPTFSTSHLLGIYRVHHAKEYLGLSRPFKLTVGGPNGLMMKVHLEEIQDSLRILAEELKLDWMSEGIIQDRRSRIARQDHGLFWPYTSQIEQQYYRMEHHRKALRSYYPHRPISLCSSKESTSLLCPLSIVNSRDGTLIELRDLRPRFGILLRSLDRLHSEALKKLQLDGDGGVCSREPVIEFLVKSIIQPEDSLPLIGSVEAPDGIPPWFNAAYDRISSFGELQLKILDYFSLDCLTNQSVEDLSLYVLATWYQIHHPSFSNSLISRLKYPQNQQALSK
ncbi:hypothetical protein PGT21_023532 [Puccinia graminis f. sp. tritici]|uniref:Uncharacterized protein n=1 Tax=Puccinia graminis f. sp. tritici TaxID=56615 RepID=A0A5B0PYI1_PUCGR|nr:hypothetical protein PGT21_023532 [Puccinia graminis f. sp. tritici]KAA1121028.1 hypothetical protein PGTUg99_027829 [Puccinia graminis f. sp. tritici]